MSPEAVAALLVVPLAFLVAGVAYVGVCLLDLLSAHLMVTRRIQTAPASRDRVMTDDRFES